MKKHITTLLAVGTLAFSVTAQSFQKMYGVPGGTDQQHLYGCVIDAEENMYASGTFRNISVFPEVSFRGTVSRLDGTGGLLWYKSYMPTGFLDMEGYFITSIFEDGDHALYTFGHYLGMTDAASGYYLQKIDASGTVIWAKHIQANQPDLFAKAVFGSNAIYAAMGDKIARFDLNGNVLGSIAIEGLIARDIAIGTGGNPSVTGEIYLDGVMHLPVICFGPELTVNSAYAYAATSGAGLFADRIIEAPATDRLVLCNDGIVLRTAQIGDVVEATQIRPLELPDNGLFSIVSFAGIVPLNESFTFAVQARGFFADDIDFQHTIVTYKMNAACVPVSGFQEVDETPFGDFGQLSADAFAVAPDNNAYFTFGKAWSADGSNSLNYVQRGKLDLQGCGEEEKELTFDYLPTSGFTVTEIHDSLIGSALLTVTPKTMVVLDIPAGIDQTYCESALGIDDPQLSVVSVFPNPASDRLNIRADDPITGPIVLRDASGRKVLSVPPTDGAIDVSGLAPGMYVVEMRIDGRTAIARFLKN